jgi:hypothetical protein
MTAIFEVIASDRRHVVLDEPGWQHVLDEHAEMEVHLEAIAMTVREPDHSGPDPRPGRMRYWRRDLGPSRWLMVVVDFSEEPARVVTAYGNRKDPPGWTP